MSDYSEDRDPFLHHLGIKILPTIEDGDGPPEYVCELPLGDHLRNRAGVMNGGAIAVLLDTVGGVAAARASGKMQIWTSNLNIQYLSPVRVGPARATAGVVRVGGRSVVADLTLVDAGDDNRLAAIGTIGLTAAS